MSPFVIFPYYLVWHYTRAIGDFFIIFGNIIWFVYHYFSFGILIRTLFKPIRSLKQFSDNHFKKRGFLLDFFINTGLIGVGFIIRIFIIGIGSISFVGLLIGGVFAFILWLVLPPLILFLMIVSLIGIFKT
jgi:hypothetical protein